MFQRILVVDPDPALAASLATSLSQAGCPARPTTNLKETPQAADLLILDPGPDCHALHQLRRLDSLPVVVVYSARPEAAFRLEAFEHGADDFWAKPLPVPEILARLSAWQRRLRTSIQIGNCRIDFARAVVENAGISHSLSMKEFLLLRYLCDHAGATLSRAELLREALGFNSTLTRTLDMHISNLRRKIEADHAHPVHIITVPGKGYLFSAPVNNSLPLEREPELI